MEHPKDVDWEGFEHFHEPKEINVSPLKPPLPQNPLSHTEPHYQPNPSSNSPPKTQSVSVKPQKTHIKPLKVQQPASNSFIPINMQKTNPNKNSDQGQEEKFPLAKTSNNKQGEKKRYERVPIVKFEEDCRYLGRVVYKGFVPRTSDNYMRLLKEVDWENWTQKKRDIRNLHGIEFNSQFESGNLNLAIEGVRIRI